jgi:hypothetical protein
MDNPFHFISFFELPVFNGDNLMIPTISVKIFRKKIWLNFYSIYGLISPSLLFIILHQKPEMRKMIYFKRCLSIFLALFFIIIGSEQVWAADFPESSNIKEKSIESVLRTLASDSMQGRDAGLPSGWRAGDYLLKQIAEMDLQPIYSDQEQSSPTAYVQKFEITGIFPQDMDNHFSVSTDSGMIPLKAGEDFFYFINSSKQPDVAAEIVFAGYAIDAPLYQYNDFVNVDCRNKVVLAYYGEPMETDSLEFFNGVHQTTYLLPETKANEIASRGGTALILIPTPENQTKYDRFLSRKNSQENKEQFMLSEESSLPVIYLSSEFTNEWLGEWLPSNFSQEQEKLRKWLQEDQQHNAPFSWEGDLSAKTAKLQIKYLNSEKRECRNIFGFIPGQDPQLKDEYILVGSHYDHEGISEGKIYYGADDNASGVSANLNAVRAFSKLTEKEIPKRSIIFAFWDAEEKGMLGSKYFTHHPAVSLPSLKCVFNMDMIGRDASFNFAALRQPMVDEDAQNKVMIFYSAQAPALAQLARQANDDLNLHLLYDPNVFFTSGSDHANFQVHKIPVLYYFTGFHTDYTSPNDTPDKIDYVKLTRITKHIANFVYILGNLNKVPDFDESIITAPEGDFKM